MNLRLGQKSGGSVHLGERVTSGAQGEIWTVRGRPELLAKVRSSPPDDYGERIALMMGLQRPTLRNAVAWPVDRLVNEKGSTIGFVMPRVENATDLHALYGPRSRKRLFPSVDVEGLIYAARNLAAAFEAVHDADCVIGDVNERVALVDDSLTVKLVDSDSFQLQTQSQTFFCDVATPEFQPPELQSVATFHGLRRSINHDAFGLAVLIFQILFLGKHPYQGRDARETVPELPHRIRQHLFCYGPMARKFGTEPPPYSLPFDFFGRSVQNLFERAFDLKAHEQGRPTAKEWREALGQLVDHELVRCKMNRAHYAGRGTQRCSLCAIERDLDDALFLPTESAAAPSAPSLPTRAEIGSLARRVDELVFPDPALLAAHLTPIRLPFNWRRALWFVIAMIVAMAAIAAGKRYFLLWLVAIGFAVVAFASDNRSRVLFERRKRASETAEALRQAVDRTQLAEIRTSAKYQVNRFERAISDLESLSQYRAELMAEIKRNAHERALLEYLAKSSIHSSQREIGLSSSLVAQLLSNGIETAADVDATRILSLRNFGPARTNMLMSWRRDLERRFPAHVERLSDQARREIDLKISKRDVELQAAAFESCRELKALVTRAMEVHRTALPEIQRLTQAAAGAAADCRI